MSAIAKIAVSAATYWLDRPYDYKIPRELEEKALPGVRVYVPFSNGNRRTEGVILALAKESSYDRLKSIQAGADPDAGADQAGVLYAGAFLLHGV